MITRLFVVSAGSVALWTVLCLLWPYSIAWWAMLGLAAWTSVSVGIFLAIAFTSNVPNTFLVRLFFFPATFLLLN